MKSIYKRTILSAACAAALGGITPSVHAANWLMLQGTEPAGAAARAKVWGFIQPEFQRTDDTKLEAGPWSGQSAIFNQMRPDLKSSEGFNVLRARLGVRGEGMPLDPKVNYFLLAEFGNNGITRQGGGSVKLTDASVTFNHIPGARVRVGVFKTPGSEEGLQAIHVFDYINFTNVTNGLLLERFFDTDGSDTYVTPAGNSGAGGSANRPNGPVSAFRDQGIQVFDTFKKGDWEHSYALMVGNGNGITRGDNDNNYETYLYWSSEKVFGGKGPRRDGWKLFAWYQDGKRTLDAYWDAAAGEFSVQDGEFDRTRYGIGTTFRKDKWRAAAEYIVADGVIFNGTDGGAVPGAAANGPGTTASFNVEPEGEADGWYVHGGYAVTNALELDVRYDVYNRMTDVANKERKFDTLTLGAQYFFNKKSRLILNYEIRNAEAPNLADDHNANKILSGMDNRIAAQVLVIF